MGEWVFNLSRDEKISLLKYKEIYDDNLTEYIIDKIVYITDMSVFELRLYDIMDSRNYIVQIFSTNYKPNNYIVYQGMLVINYYFEGCELTYEDNYKLSKYIRKQKLNRILEKI